MSTPEPEAAEARTERAAPVAAKAPPAAPRSGVDVIGFMRRTYPSRELRSLAFTVRTTRPQADSSNINARTYAVLPGRMRVEHLPVAARSGYVRDRQRLAVFRRGQRVSTANKVDLRTLLAYDIFAQGSDTTIAYLDSARVRYGRVRRDRFAGRPVWVVGAAEHDDTTAQFWVDAERWRVVRVIQREPRAPSVVTDVRYTKYTELLDTPVPTRIEVWRGGKLVEEQELSEFVVNPALTRRSFDLSRWRASAPAAE